jgi:hypothetical protein
MPRRVAITKAGVRSVVVTEAHHRAGYMRIGPRSKVWCSCGWKTALEGTYTAMMEAFESHKQGSLVDS